MRYTVIVIIFSFILTGCVQNNTQLVLKSITFTHDTLNVSAGSAIQLSPVFIPAAFSNLPVDWTSSDTNVASLSSGGVMFAKKTGSAWITVKDKNGFTSGKCYIIISQ